MGVAVGTIEFIYSHWYLINNPLISMGFLFLIALT